MARSPLNTVEVTGESAGSRLDRFLRRSFPSLRQGQLQKLLRKRAITLNGGRIPAGQRVKSGDRIELWVDLAEYTGPPERLKATAERMRRSEAYRRHFRVLHEDDWIVVLDKPGGLVVHPGPGHYVGDTLLDLLRAHLPVYFSPGSPFRPGFVHRLDRGTSGVLVAAKTHQAAKRLEASFREGGTRKTYLALVSGHLPADQGSLKAPLVRRPRAGQPTRVRAVDDREGTAPGAREALTLYSVVRRFPNSTLLSIEPQTGRTHQIRVHLASHGWPIIGDGDYGLKDLNRHFRESFGLARTFLHAARLEIPHPEDGGLRMFEAPLPEDLKGVLEKL
jgi:RluA family pseudouridine synthase